MHPPPDRELKHAAQCGGFAVDRGGLGALLAPIQLIAPHRVSRDPFHRPPAEQTAQVTEAAVQRLVALAERAPDTYSTEVVEHLAEVADKALLLTLLSPLRRIAGSVPAFRSRVLAVAVSALQKGASHRNSTLSRGSIRRAR